MGFLFKTVILTTILVVAGYFVLTKIPAVKNWGMEVINPSLKEAKVLGELKTNLDDLEANLSELGTVKKPGELALKVQKNKDLISQTKTLLDKATNLNSDSGIVSSTIGQIINLISDKTPYPADHLTPSNQPTPNCPVIK